MVCFSCRGVQAAHLIVTVHTTFLLVSVPLYLTSYAGQLRIFPHLTNALQLCLSIRVMLRSARHRISQKKKKISI
jgi:hypothetical protein